MAIDTVLFLIGGAGLLCIALGVLWGIVALVDYMTSYEDELG